MFDGGQELPLPDNPALTEIYGEFARIEQAERETASSISLLEVITSFAMDEFGLSRRTAAIGMTAGIFLLGVPASLSLGIWGDVLFFGMNFFDLLDYMTSKLLMPLGELLLALFVGWKVWPLVVSELSKNQPTSGMLAAMRRFCQFMAPALIGWIMVASF